jgi:hypothetical protein
MAARELKQERGYVGEVFKKITRNEESQAHHHGANPPSPDQSKREKRINTLGSMFSAKSGKTHGMNRFVSI